VHLVNIQFKSVAGLPLAMPSIQHRSWDENVPPSAAEQL